MGSKYKVNHIIFTLYINTGRITVRSCTRKAPRLYVSHGTLQLLALLLSILETKLDLGSLLAGIRYSKWKQNKRVIIHHMAVLEESLGWAQHLGASGSECRNGLEGQLLPAHRCDPSTFHRLISALIHQYAPSLGLHRQYPAS